MSFLDGVPRVATEEDCRAKWGGHEPGSHFRCFMCGYRFQVGDIWRCVYTNGLEGTFERDGTRYAKYSGNPLICTKCDGPDIIDRWKAKCDDHYSDKNWWFTS